MPRPGIKTLQCQGECGEVKEVEVGIRKMYCCAKPMLEVEVEEPEEQAPTLRLKPRQ